MFDALRGLLPTQRAAGTAAAEAIAELAYEPPPPPLNSITRGLSDAVRDQISTASRASDAVSSNNRRLDTGVYDDQGRMVIYYSEGLDGVSPEIAESLRSQYGDHDDMDFNPTPQMRSIYQYAMHQYEAVINVSFRPISEAPPGTTPNFVLATFRIPRGEDGGNVLAQAQFPSQGPMLYIDRDDYRPGSNTFDLMETMLHEFGHKFGLVHPHDPDSNNRDDTGNVRNSSTTMASGYRPTEFTAVTPLMGDANALYALGYQPAPQRGENVVGLRPRSDYSFAGPNTRLTLAGPWQGDNGLMTAAAYYRDRPNAPGASMQADTGIVFDDGMGRDERVTVSPHNRVTRMEGSPGDDRLAASLRRATRMEGGDGLDQYIIPTTQPGGRPHVIVDRGLNRVQLAQGARVAITYEGEGPHMSRLDVDFPIRDVQSVLMNGRVILTIHSQNPDAPPTFVSLPPEDQQLLNGNLVVHSAAGNVTAPQALSSPELPNENDIVVTAQPLPQAGAPSRGR